MVDALTNLAATLALGSKRKHYYTDLWSMSRHTSSRFQGIEEVKAVYVYEIDE